MPDLQHAPRSGWSEERTVNHKVLATSRFVSAVMGRVDAFWPPVHIGTFVPCVELLTIWRNPALRHKLFSIVTTLRWGEWWDQLKMAGSLLYFYDIPRGICAGFNMGVL
jgi:hypothetical protein